MWRNLVKLRWYSCAINLLIIKTTSELTYKSFLFSNSFSSRDDDFNPTSQRLSAHEIGQKILARRRIDNQKVATFYRESDSEQPELRILIDSRRYSNLDSLIEELTRILNLKDYEKQVHSWNGRRLGDIEDFEDGGLYFFTFSPNDKRFPQALSVVTDSEKVWTTISFFFFNAKAPLEP